MCSSRPTNEGAATGAGLPGDRIGLAVCPTLVLSWAPLKRPKLIVCEILHEQSTVPKRLPTKDLLD